MPFSIKSDGYYIATFFAFILNNSNNLLFLSKNALHYIYTYLTTKVSYLIVDEADVEFEKLQDASLENECFLNLDIPKFERKTTENIATEREDTVETIISDIELDINNIDVLQTKRNVII